MNYKIYTFFLVILSVLTFALHCIEQTKPTDSQKTQKTVFLWDIHDVMLKRDIGQTARSILGPKNIFYALKYMNRPLLSEIVNSFKKNGTLECLIEKSIYYNNPYLARILIDQQNAQYPIAGTWDIIKELHTLGYTHYIGSNISKHSFNELINKNKHPQLATIFTYFNLEAPQVADSDCIVKPNPEYFRNFLERNGINLETTQVIFIDDRIKNVETANDLGFIGIHFKSPAQLRKELIKLGIELEQSYKVPYAQLNARIKKVRFNDKVIVHTYSFA